LTFYQYEIIINMIFKGAELSKIKVTLDYFYGAF